MKRLIILFLSISVFFCGCISNPNSNTPPTDFTPIDFSYEHVAELTEFKCYLSYQNTSITIEGNQAKELYKQIWHSITESEQNPSGFDQNYVYLVFYDGVKDPVSSNSTYYGTYTIYENGWLSFSLSPFHSASFDYKLEPSIFNEVIVLISNS